MGEIIKFLIYAISMCAIELVINSLYNRKSITDNAGRNEFHYKRTPMDVFGGNGNRSSWHNPGKQMEDRGKRKSDGDTTFISEKYSFTDK